MYSPQQSFLMCTQPVTIQVRGKAIVINRKVHFTENSTIIDPAGRFIIVNLSIQDMKFCIANIYCPNFDDPSFFPPFSLHSLFTVVIGGDFNMVLDSGIDRLSTTGSLRNWQSTNIVIY